MLPRSYVKIRHYGLLASASVKTHLETARRLLAGAPSSERAEPLDWRARLLALTGIDVTLCPACQKRTIERSVSVRPPVRSARGRPTWEAVA